MTIGTLRRFGPHKKEERIQLEQLIRLYPGFPDGHIALSESPDFIVHTSRTRRTGIELTRWTVSGEGPFKDGELFTPPYSMEMLGRLIQKKEALLSLYKKRRLERIWLVILVNGFTHSPAFNLQNHLENQNIQTGFDAILLFDLVRSKVYEIKPPLY
jgi:hypothetical protein